MKSEYIELVEQLKSQLKSLNEELRDCLEEQGYKRANHFQKAVWMAENELRRVEGLIQRTHYLDGQEIDMAIVELDLGIITHFDIVWESNRRFQLHFGISGSFQLYCELPSEEVLKNYYMTSKGKLRLTNLGFTEDSSTNSLRLYFDLPKNKSCLEIKERLAILFFEVLWVTHDFRGRELKAYIVKYP
jgi:hypothetical protein